MGVVRKVRRFQRVAPSEKYHPQKGSAMPELLTASTYLVVWLVCGRVIGIESGLTKLIISLVAAIFVHSVFRFI